MCDIFPELDNCCYFLTLRVAMLFIAVFSITTGCATLSAVEKFANANKDKAQQAAQAVMNQKDFENIKNSLFSNMSEHILSTIALMSVLFMISGLFLLIADLMDEEGLVQIFVWVEFVNVVIGFILLILVAYECAVKDSCLLKMDWLSGAFCLTAWFFFMIVWLYFISVANSYVLNGDTQ